MHVRFIFLFIFFLIPMSSSMHELGSYERIDDINGTKFKYKLFFDNGELIKDFFIDEQEVSEEIFNQKKLCFYIWSKFCGIEPLRYSQLYLF